jgi:hypothetical protein
MHLSQDTARRLRIGDTLTRVIAVRPNPTRGMYFRLPREWIGAPNSIDWLIVEELASHA